MTTTDIGTVYERAYNAVHQAGRNPLRECGPHGCTLVSYNEVADVYFLVRPSRDGVAEYPAELYDVGAIARELVRAWSAEEA